MFKPIVRLAAATFVAGIVAFAVTTAPAAIGQQAKPPSPPPLAKADRLPVAIKGTACSLRGWPDFEPKCQFDVRESTGKARTVRVIALR